MPFNIDIAIFVGFLVINLTVGLFYSRGIKNIREYAVGNRSFSTSTIAATVIATCIGGGFFSEAVTESYRQGLYFIIPALGEPLAIMIVGYFLAPRMAEFLGSISVAEAMGNLYGKKVQLIAAIAAIFLCIGIVALQFKVSSTILQIFFGVSSFYAVLASAIIVILYSAFGGIKAVTFTDVIQFFTFGTIIPVISLIIWGTFNDPYKAFTMISNNPLFDIKEAFDIHNLKFINSTFLLLFFLIPELQPVFFQRVVMCSDTRQAKKAFLIAGSICLIMLLVIVWVGVLLLADNPNLEPNNLLAYIIGNYSYIGLKGLTAIGVMSIIMSTADSYINSAAVLFTNDFLKGLNLKVTKELLLLRIFSVFIGIGAFFLAFKTSSILDLLLKVLAFYSPIVTPAILLAIFGFRSSSKAVLIGMAAGVLTVLSFEIFKITIVNAVVPGMIINMLVFISSHYLLKQAGGWVGIKDNTHLLAIKIERQRKIKKWINNIKHFNFLKFCQNNQPKYEYVYPMFGFFCMISVFSTMYSLPYNIRQHNAELLNVIDHTVLIVATVCFTYPIWPAKLKNEKFIAVIWSFIVPYTLIFIPVLLVIMSNFDQLQLMIFMINLIMIATIFRWQVALLMIIASVMAGFKFYTYFMSTQNELTVIDISLQFKIMYPLLLFSSILLVFIKPKQELQELTEQKAEHLGEQVHDREEELEKSLGIKNEFLCNINHEVHAPMTGIASLSETLWESYDKLTDSQRRQAVETIAKSAWRLNGFLNNMLDLSKLSSLNYQLNRQQVNLSELLHNRLEICQKLYLNDKKLEFIITIADSVIANCDERYLQSTFDNLIINAIIYSKKGKIIIKLGNNKSKVEFTIQDEGIGIPVEELQEVFGAFIVSSKTKTLAGGRGVGLALCKKVIEVHGGKIWAESTGEQGATFKFTLPKIQE